jgi:hypothetical protein
MPVDDVVGNKIQKPIDDVAGKFCQALPYTSTQTPLRRSPSEFTRRYTSVSAEPVSRV